jgi:hypothetical protein
LNLKVSIIGAFIHTIIDTIGISIFSIGWSQIRIVRTRIYAIGKSVKICIGFLEATATRPGRLFKFILGALIRVVVDITTVGCGLRTDACSSALAIRINVQVPSGLRCGAGATLSLSLQKNPRGCQTYCEC